MAPEAASGTRHASLGIRAWLAVAMVLAVLIPSSLLGTLSAFGIRGQAETEATEGSLALVRVVGFGLNAVLEDARRTLEMVAVLPEVADSSWDDTPTGNPLSQRLAALARRYPLFSELYLIDASGRVVLVAERGGSDSEIKGFSPELADNYGGYISDVYRSASGSPHIFMVVEVRASDLTKRGFVAAEVDLSRLHADLRRALASSTDEQWRLLIVDSQGRPIYPASAWGDATLRHTNPAVDRVLSTLSEGHVTYEDDAGVEWFATYKSMMGYNPFRGVRWGVVVQRPVSDAFASADIAVRNTILVAAGFLVFALFASAPIARQLTASLTRLAEHTRIVGERGVVEAPAPDPALQARTDAIGALARALALMQRDLKVSQDELERRHDALRKAERLSGVGILAAGVAHEINNPLTTILGYSEFLVEDKPTDDPERPALELIASEAGRVQEIVRGLLELSRRRGGPQDIDLSSLCQRALTLSQAGLKMDEVDAQVVESDAEVILSADPQALLQLLMNLISNAVDALEGIDGATLEIGFRSGEDGVEIWVEDNGTGMDSETRAQIFEPFFTSKEAGKGTGLGLAVVHSIADDHGATITVRSSPGRGARFSLLFLSGEAEEGGTDSDP